MSRTALQQIRNFYRVAENIATGGQPAPEQFTAIRLAGFDVIINLALADSPGAVKDEHKIIHELGMVYEHIPVHFRKPELADLNLFFNCMERHREQKIFVHCAYNWRVSSFIFLYRTIKCHCPVAEALSDLHAVWHPDSTWQGFIESALQSHNIEH